MRTLRFPIVLLAFVPVILSGCFWNLEGDIFDERISPSQPRVTLSAEQASPGEFVTATTTVTVNVGRKAVPRSQNVEFGFCFRFEGDGESSCHFPSNSDVEFELPENLRLGEGQTLSIARTLDLEPNDVIELSHTVSLTSDEAAVITVSNLYVAFEPESGVIVERFGILPEAGPVLTFE